MQDVTIYYEAEPGSEAEEAINEFKRANEAWRLHVKAVLERAKASGLPVTDAVATHMHTGRVIAVEMTEKPEGWKSHDHCGYYSPYKNNAAGLALMSELDEVMHTTFPGSTDRLFGVREGRVGFSVHSCGWRIVGDRAFASAHASVVAQGELADGLVEIKGTDYLNSTELGWRDRLRSELEAYEHEDIEPEDHTS